MSSACTYHPLRLGPRSLPRLAGSVVPSVLLLGIFTYLLMIPDPGAACHCLAAAESWVGNDYLIHFTGYLVLSLLVFLLPAAGPAWPAVWFPCLYAHGALSETAQLWVPLRTWDPWDLACNLLGISTGFFLWSVRTGSAGERGRRERHPWRSMGWMRTA